MHEATISNDLHLSNPTLRLSTRHARFGVGSNSQWGEYVGIWGLCPQWGPGTEQSLVRLVV